MKSEGHPLRTYACFGLLAAAAMTVFVFHPVDLLGGLILFILGFLVFAQVVWNTSRVPRLAEAAYQAACNPSHQWRSPWAHRWGRYGGVAIDRFGLPALIAGVGILTVISVAVLVGSMNKVHKEK